jgi:hypothetical protein
MEPSPLFLCLPHPVIFRFGGRVSDFMTVAAKGRPHTLYCTYYRKQIGLVPHSTSQPSVNLFLNKP